MLAVFSVFIVAGFLLAAASITYNDCVGCAPSGWDLVLAFGAALMVATLAGVKGQKPTRLWTWGSKVATGGSALCLVPTVIYLIPTIRDCVPDHYSLRQWYPVYVSVGVGFLSILMTHLLSWFFRPVIPAP